MNRKTFLRNATLAGATLLTSNKLAARPTPYTPTKLAISHADRPNICKTCGTRYAEHQHRADECAVCLDDRQYLKASGQEWVSFTQLADGHSIKVKAHSEHLHELSITPRFAIGQRAFFIQTPAGNVLWDCLPLLTEPVVDFIRQRGGLQAIAISHPHYYSLMQEWSKAFQCPIYIHAADRQWVMDKSENIVFWNEKRLPIQEDIELIHTGGHFPGSAILRASLPSLAATIFVGDTLYLSLDKRHLSAMHSYPNFIPLRTTETLRVLSEINTLDFEALFGAFAHQNIYHNAKNILEDSLAKYQQTITR